MLSLQRAAKLDAAWPQGSRIAPFVQILCLVCKITAKLDAASECGELRDLTRGLPKQLLGRRTRLLLSSADCSLEECLTVVQWQKTSTSLSSVLGINLDGLFLSFPGLANTIL